MSLTATSLRLKALEVAKRLQHSRASVAHVLSAALGELNEDQRQSLQPIIDSLLALETKVHDTHLIEVDTSGELAIRELVGNRFSVEVFTKLIDNKDLFSAPQIQAAGAASGATSSDRSTEDLVSPVLEAPTQDRTLEEVLAELDSLIGLDEVKKQVRSVMATHLVNEKRSEMGLKVVPNSLHLVFSGEPGTGKTTVARLVAEIYRAQGILKKGHLVEVGRADLIAEYVGQTAPKVTNAVKRALGGVLFIDEAYTLALDVNGVGFGAEAIGTLLQLMETHKNEVSIIAAGYKDQMDFFVGSNPGLRSRFQTYIDFPKFSVDELIEIFELMSKSHQIEFSAEVILNVRKHFSSNETSGEAGNARYVRKLFEASFANLSGRAMADGVIEDHEVVAFQPEDIPETLPQSTKNKNKLGF